MAQCQPVNVLFMNCVLCLLGHHCHLIGPLSLVHLHTPPLLVAAAALAASGGLAPVAPVVASYAYA